uniref:Uncharacterized protein n=1 Tax=Halimeda discoidea TaxID=118222 RepID=A0A1C9JB27_9CHLO|nr:hypothetical protein [Halimeda discoidea]
MFFKICKNLYMYWCFLQTTKQIITLYHPQHQDQHQDQHQELSTLPELEMELANTIDPDMDAAFSLSEAAAEQIAAEQIANVTEIEEVSLHISHGNFKTVESLIIMNTLESFCTIAFISEIHNPFNLVIKFVSKSLSLLISIAYLPTKFSVMKYRGFSMVPNYSYNGYLICFVVYFLRIALVSHKLYYFINETESIKTFYKKVVSKYFKPIKKSKSKKVHYKKILVLISNYFKPKPKPKPKPKSKPAYILKIKNILSLSICCFCFQERVLVCLALSFTIQEISLSFKLMKNEDSKLNISTWHQYNVFF